MARKTGAAPAMFDRRLKVTAKPVIGFWRGGTHHPAEAVEHAGGTFTVDQAEAIQDEPMLVVEDLGPEAPATPES